MTAVDPDIIPELYDFAMIAGHATPGLCQISQGGKVLKWDSKPGFGQDGATIKLTGIEPGEFDMKLIFYHVQDGVPGWDSRNLYLTQILPELESTADGKKAVDFYHPLVSEPPMNVTAVTVKKFGVLEQDGDGTWSVTHKLMRWYPPKKAGGAPNGAKKKDKKEDVLDENQKRIEELTKELKEVWK
jgi:hypothetical protein